MCRSSNGLVPYVRIVAGCLALLVLGCGDPPDGALPVGPATQEHPDYHPPKALAFLANRDIDESSGIAVSHRREGVFWTHNDSGDSARVFAFDRSGKDLGSHRISGAAALDWEDMCSYVHGGKSYLLLADVGDNSARRKRCTLYLAEEPADGAGPARLVQTVHFTYADGPHNCESVAVDPATRQVLLVSKVRGEACKVYALDWPAPSDPLATAMPIATLKISTTTAMDISSDGRRAVVLTFRKRAYEYVRGKDETWATAFSRKGRLITMPSRKQGESICYGRDGRSLYLTSERTPTPLWEVRAKDEARP